MRQEVYTPAQPEAPGAGPQGATQEPLIGSFEDEPAHAEPSTQMASVEAPPSGKAPEPRADPASVPAKPRDTSVTIRIPEIPEGDGDEDAGILEVEDLIKMHLQDGVLPGADEQEGATEPMLDPSTVFGAQLMMAGPLERLDQWIVARGFAP